MTLRAYDNDNDEFVRVDRCSKLISGREQNRVTFQKNLRRLISFQSGIDDAGAKIARFAIEVN